MAEEVSSARRARFRNIQILRFIAATAVVLYHSNGTAAKYLTPAAGGWPLSYGYLGVDLFFVVSGFIIHYTVSTREGRPLTFLARRIERIVPLYWLSTFAFGALLLVLPSLFRSANAATSGAHFLKSLFYVAFTDNHEPVIYVGWSLEYEMFFYLLVTAALALMPRDRIWMPITALLSILVIAGAVFRLSSVYLPCQPLVLEFVFGILVAQTLTGARTYLPCLLPLVALIVLAASGQGARVVYAGPVSALLLYGASRLDSPGLRGLVYDTCVKLGDASYSIYLTQVFTMSAAIKATTKLLPSGSAWVAIVLATVTTLIVAWVVHIAVEKPLHDVVRRWEKGRARPAVSAA